MKKIIFCIGAVLLLFPLENGYAATKIFTGIYERVGKNIDTQTSEIVGEIIGAETEQINALVRGGTFVDEESKTTILEVCRHAADGKISEGSGIISKYDESICISNIQKMWEIERGKAATRALDFEQSVAFSRWWDGVLDSKNDFDILHDIERIEKQFFGKDSESIIIPRASLGNQRAFSLVENNYRLPADELAFNATGGCGGGEASLYGGLVCIPQFCTDFACIRIKAIPGRKASGNRQGVAQEKSVKNIVNKLNEIALVLRDAKALTPTRNSNNSFFFSGIFDGDQEMKQLITFKTRVPPMFSDLIATETDENLERKMEFQKEFERVRKDVFSLCKENPSDCMSEDVLESIRFECKLELNAVPTGGSYETAKKCLDEKEVYQQTNIKYDWIENQKIRNTTKKEFYDNIPNDLNILWTELEAFQQEMGKLSIERIKEATKQCGTPKQSSAQYNL